MRVVTSLVGIVLLVLSFNPDIPKTFLSSFTEQTTESVKTVNDSLDKETEQARLEEEGKLAYLTLGSVDTVVIQTTGIGKKYRRHGIDETKVQSEVTKRSQGAGLTVKSRNEAISSPMAALMNIHMHIVFDATTGVYSYIVKVDVKQNVPGANAIWSDAINNRARATQLRRVNDDILTIIDRFIRDYEAGTRG